ncbi:hypothetical protein E1301_Tti020124 [Triplophysa tibetana]|uniref:Uncharacterized protein n=1 Tax=Triplophysa tibetana TaxID=1572043 RepID=A0A5A9PI84_9TELE|nr:hypothetical protein E1301_Tti020124 [Triplophysa tibetana]
MFYIVEFLEIQEVEIVPALWVGDEICQWPDHYEADELVRAIRSKEQPGHTWDAFRVRILHTAANYKTARLKLPEAEAHTDLQTAEEDEDDNPKKKRKRLPNVRFESESEEEVTVKQKRILPPAPKIKMPNFDVQSAIRRHVQRPEPPKQMKGLDLRRSLTSPEPRDLVKSPEHGRLTSPEPSWSVTSPQPHQLDEIQRHSGTSTSNGLASLLHKLLTNQEKIMEQLKIIQSNLNKTGQPVQGQDPLKGDVLPLKDMAALLALEKRLREEEDLKNKMHCFTKPLAKQLNWRGINGKTAFGGLHMKNVITVLCVDICLLWDTSHAVGLVLLWKLVSSPSVKQLGGYTLHPVLTLCQVAELSYSSSSRLRCRMLGFPVGLVASAEYYGLGLHPVAGAAVCWVSQLALQPETLP